VSVQGAVIQLGASHRHAVVFAALVDGDEPLTIDPFQLGASPPGPKGTGPVTSVTVDEGLSRLALTHPNGALNVFEVATGEVVGPDIFVIAPVGWATVDPQTHRLFQPSKLGYLSVVQLAGTPQIVPSTPWLVGGIPVAAAYDSLQERIFMADTQSDSIRVVGAMHGAGLTGDAVGNLGEPVDVALDVAADRLFAAYPAANQVGAFVLSTLQLAGPPAVAIADGPSRLLYDALHSRLLIVSAKGDKLHLLNGGDLGNVVGSPVTVAAGPVDVVVVWSRPGRLILNEVMLQPPGVTPEDGQWIELHNPSSETQDLTGVELATALTSYTLVPVNGSLLSVPPAGHVVVCSNPSALVNGGVSCDFSFSADPPSPLETGGFELFLKESNGTVIDSADLKGQVPGGQALALKHPGYNNARRYSWADSVGTPGAPNLDVSE
jgi:hypothetical protein